MFTPDTLLLLGGKACAWSSFFGVPAEKARHPHGKLGNLPKLDSVKADPRVACASYHLMPDGKLQLNLAMPKARYSVLRQLVLADLLLTSPWPPSFSLPSRFFVEYDSLTRHFSVPAERESKLGNLDILSLRLLRMKLC